MASDQRKITIKSLDRASVIEADTDETPAMIYNGQTRLFEFQFPSTPAVRDCLIQIEQGLKVDALLLLECRNRLFRKLKGGR